MPNVSALASPLHVISAIVWVGGMFFAYIILRPAVDHMGRPERLKLLNEIFERFFLWVALAAAILPMTGYAQIFFDYGGFENVGAHIATMHITGWVMVGLFLYVYAGPFQKFKAHVAAEEWPEAAARLNTIRLTIAVNLVLGLITSVFGASGRFWI